jgi:purine-binding chemotaxis protein CheW
VEQLFVMRLDQQRYALRLQDVVRVVRMVEIAGLPEATPPVVGLINVQGQVLSVVDLRACLHLPEREAALDDVLIIVRTAKGMVALAADGVEGVYAWPEEATVAGAEIHPPPLHLEGVVKQSDGLVFICDLDRLIAAGPRQGCGGGPSPVLGGAAGPGGQEGDSHA